MLIGIKPEYIKLTTEDREIYINDVIVGLYDGKISKDYDSLVGLELLEGDEKNANTRNFKQNVRKVHTKK